MHDQVAKRKVKDYGYDYSFEQKTIVKTEDIPQPFLPLKRRCEVFAKLPEEALQECLVTEYPKGATIGWHRDAYTKTEKKLLKMESYFCVEGSAEIDANLQHVSEIERDVQRKKNRTISRVFFPFWYYAFSKKKRRGQASL